MWIFVFAPFEWHFRVAVVVLNLNKHVYRWIRADCEIFTNFVLFRPLLFGELVIKEFWSFFIMELYIDFARFRYIDIDFTVATTSMTTRSTSSDLMVTKYCRLPQCYIRVLWVEMLCGSAFTMNIVEWCELMLKLMISRRIKMEHHIRCILDHRKEVHLLRNNSNTRYLYKLCESSFLLRLNDIFEWL